MGIYDRDYMKRPPERGGGRGLSGEERLEQLAGNFLARHRRLLLGLGLALAALIVAGLVWALL